MVVVPISGKISWKNPPIITICLILINCFIYFIFQLNDNDYYMTVERYYFTCGLAEIEVPRYDIYLKDKDGGVPDIQADEAMDEDQLFGLYMKMRQDGLFLKKLHEEEIITEADRIYEEWKDLRAEYEELQSKMFSISYGLIPAKKRIFTFFSYMFLHGSIDHLIGNMMFLWLIGCILEMGSGRLVYCFTYILTGLGGALFFWLLNMYSMIPLVGASGAISGIMGAFTVMFGKDRVKVFYSLGFYFNYVRFSGLFLLPIWIGKECCYLFFGPESNVAYDVHIGGIVSGVFIGFLALKFFGRREKDMFKEEPEDEVAPLLAKAMQCVGELDMEGGRKALKLVFEKEPDNLKALQALFNIEKHEPEDTRFHDAAKNLLHNLCMNKVMHGEVFKVYSEYIRLTKPRLTPRFYVRLSSIMASTGHIPHAEKIAIMLFNNKPEVAGLPSVLLKLARLLDKEDDKKSKKMYKMIQTKYPDSREAHIAGRALTR